MKEVTKQGRKERVKELMKEGGRTFARKLCGIKNLANTLSTGKKSAC